MREAFKNYYCLQCFQSRERLKSVSFDNSELCGSPDQPDKMKSNENNERFFVLYMKRQQRLRAKNIGDSLSGNYRVSSRLSVGSRLVSIRDSLL